LPRAPGIATGVLSADGRLLAFTLERPALDPRHARQDPRYEQGHPIPPADIAILHLDTGALYVAPGIETPAKMRPALAFGTDGRWLVMALNAGTKTRLLIWRPRLTYPYESARRSWGWSGSRASRCCRHTRANGTTFKLGIDQGRRAQTRH
jgi:hypothetical protein